MLSLKNMLQRSLLRYFLFMFEDEIYYLSTSYCSKIRIFIGAQQRRLYDLLLFNIHLCPLITFGSIIPILISLND